MNTMIQTQVKTEPNISFMPVQPGRLQRKCISDECEESRKERLTLQRRPTNQAEPGGVPLIVRKVLNSQGQPLDTSTRAFLEPRFGHDFSRVRVHTDAHAAESAHAVNAYAYTVGQDVVFGTGQYAPGTSEGRKMLAHELTHVVQQGANTIRDRIEISPPDDAHELDAHKASELANGLPGRTPGTMPTRHLEHIALQRWAYGTGAPPHADYAVVPDGDKKRIETAMDIVSRVVNNPKDYPRCPRFFKDHCPGGKDNTLAQVFNNAVLWKDTDPSPTLLGSSVDPHHIAYTKISYGVGRWAVAASMFHELIHNCGVASHDVGDDAKEACGKLPNI